MPLSMVELGKENIIKRIAGKEESKKFLEALGFNCGTTVIVISANNGNIITKIKESRIAISKEMACKIMV